jgi:hypothetical protein
MPAWTALRDAPGPRAAARSIAKDALTPERVEPAGEDVSCPRRMLVHALPRTMTGGLPSGSVGVAGVRGHECADDVAVVAGLLHVREVA